jgi:TonB family protein
MAPLEGRALRILSYEELVKGSDLVAIATPTGETADTSEELVLTEVYLEGADGRGSYMKGIGVETGFKVAAVIKGDPALKEFILHHYRNADPGPVVNGPMLVTFGKSDLSPYLMFLIRQSDGRYAPTGGQIDPGYNAINRLQYRITAGSTLSSPGNCGLIHYVRAAYPEAARQAHIQGVVRVEYLVTKEGKVKELHALSGDPLLVPAAIAAVAQWRYSPCRPIGPDPIEIRQEVQVPFTLNQ